MCIAATQQSANPVAAGWHCAGWFSNLHDMEPVPVSPPFKNPKRREYAAVKLRDLLAGTASGAYEITSAPCLPGFKLNVPRVLFGDKAEPGFSCSQHPPGWNPGPFMMPGINNYTIRNAIVHGEFGMVTVGDLVIRETLRHLHHGAADIAEVAPDIISVPDAEPELSVGHGAHVSCGFVGTRNYAHYIIDVLTAALVPPFNDAHAKATIITSPMITGYQREYMRYYPEFFQRALFLNGATRVFCNELQISGFVERAEHYTTHPHHGEVIRTLRDRMLAENPGLSEGMPRKIYINRLDAPARRLINEPDIIKCLEAHGFASVSLTGWSVTQQAALLSNATHVITPHGAGGVNALYSPPGTKFLELLPSQFVQWTIRRILGLVPVQYGCVIGREEDDNLPLHQRKWRVDVKTVDAAAREMLDM